MATKKQTSKKILSLLLAIVMLIGIAQIPMFANINVEAATEYKVGDIVEFGSYPQTLVTDKELIDALNKTKTPTISYQYFASGAPGNWMYYCDIEYNGSIYRGVKIEEYRPNSTDLPHSKNVQEKNGYKRNNTYWFKYESVKWKVLDPEKGLLLSNVIIDTQPHTNRLRGGAENEYGFFATDYKTSSIRNWLDSNFKTVAFTEEQSTKIMKTVNDNSAAKPSSFGYFDLNGESTEDYCFLLSYSDATNEKYGFTDDESRKATATDYAKCQGLLTTNADGELLTYNWILRGAVASPAMVSNISSSGLISTSNVNFVSVSGIRPAMVVDLSKITKEDIGEGSGSGENTGSDTGSGSGENTGSGEGTGTGSDTGSGEGTGSETDKDTSGKKLSVSLSGVNVYYKVSKSINPTITVADGVKYTVAYKVKDTTVAKIDENNSIVGLKLGGETTLTCVVTDEFGNKAEASTEIRVDYSFCQFIVLTIIELVKTLIEIITSLI